MPVAALAAALLVALAGPARALELAAPPVPPAPAPATDAETAETVEGTAASAEAPPIRRRYVIEKIRIDGLSHTRPSEVRKRLDLREGEVLDERAVLLARLRLAQLGWFSRVETRVERGSARGLVVLVIDLTERNTLVVSDLVIGSTGPQPIYGGFGLAEGNFLGRGLGLSGAFVYGGTPSDQPLAPARFALRAAFADPEFEALDTRFVAGISGLLIRGEEFTCADPGCDAYGGHYGRAPRLQYERLGGEATLGFRPGTFERLQAGFRVERLSATFVADAAGVEGPNPPSIRPGRSFLTAVTLGYDRDTRNDLFLPTNGTRLNVALALGSEMFGGDYEYSRYLLQLEGDGLLPWGHALKLLGAAGAVQGDAPFFERFYAADWAYFSVGPALGRALELNFSTDSRYDAYLGMVGAEYAIPLWSGGRFFHRGYLALGARALFTAERAKAGRTPASSTPFSAETALRLDTPVGSFNLSLGYLLDNLL